MHASGKWRKGIPRAASATITTHYKPEARVPTPHPAATLTARGLPGLIEASRRGGHLWLLLDAPTPATSARRVLLHTLDAPAARGGLVEQQGVPLRDLERQAVTFPQAVTAYRAAQAICDESGQT